MILSDFYSVAISTFGLISLAEIGDKSQLVCMTLAARYRHWPVLLGAAMAFLILNVLAVSFGASVSSWVPERVMAGLVAEFGDKTQIAVAGLASSFEPWPVWLGSTIALISVSALSVWAGRTLLQRIPIHWLHRLSGGVFLFFALIEAWSALA